MDPEVGEFLEWKAARKAEEELLARMSEAAKTIIECVGEDVTREGLVDTPMRMAKAMRFFTKGYRETLEEVVGDALFPEQASCDGMVMMRDIQVW